MLILKIIWKSVKSSDRDDNASYTEKYQVHNP